MPNSEEQELALSMIRLYGRNAETVAAGHAETHAEMGEPEKSDKWRRVAAMVKRMRLERQAG
jgi:hypothetical protein